MTWLSLRNVASVHILAVDQLNTYDVLLSDDVVFTKGAYDAFVSGSAVSSTRPATIVEAPAHDETPPRRPRPTTARPSRSPRRPRRPSCPRARRPR